MPADTITAGWPSLGELGDVAEEVALATDNLQALAETSAFGLSSAIALPYSARSAAIWRSFSAICAELVEPYLRLVRKFVAGLRRPERLVPDQPIGGRILLLLSLEVALANRPQRLDAALEAHDIEL